VRAEQSNKKESDKDRAPLEAAKRRIRPPVEETGGLSSQGQSHQTSHSSQKRTL